MPNAPAPDRAAAIQSLCTHCGLCCDGSLFADVRLRPADQPARLAGLGLAVGAAGPRTCLAQPCAAFDGRHCQIYALRPRHCREFECGLLQSVITGERTVGSAVQCIRRARRQVEALHALLARLDELSTDHPLVSRYARVMNQPVDLSAPESSRLRGRLLRGMGRWMATAEQEFLSVISNRRGTRPDPGVPAA